MFMSIFSLLCKHVGFTLVCYSRARKSLSVESEHVALFKILIPAMRTRPVPPLRVVSADPEAPRRRGDVVGAVEERAARSLEERVNSLK